MMSQAKVVVFFAVIITLGSCLPDPRIQELPNEAERTGGYDDDMMEGLMEEMIDDMMDKCLDYWPYSDACRSIITCRKEQGHPQLSLHNLWNVYC